MLEFYKFAYCGALVLSFVASLACFLSNSLDALYAYASGNGIKRATRLRRERYSITVDGRNRSKAPSQSIRVTSLRALNQRPLLEEERKTSARAEDFSV